MKKSILLLLAVFLFSILKAQSPSDSSRAKLHTIISSVQLADVYQYDTKDNRNQSMDCAKIIPNPNGGYLAIYHHYVSGVPKVFVSTSIDFVSWNVQSTLASKASQPTIAEASDGGYVVAWEQEPNNHIKVVYFENLVDLFNNSVTKSFDCPQSLSTCAEGTPNIYKASSSSVDIGFHYYKNCDVDRQAHGVLTDFTEWNAQAVDDLDNALLYWGIKGNIGDRDNFVYDEYDFGLIEGQFIKHDFGSWRTFIYDYQTGNAEQLEIKTHKGSTAFANPTTTMMTIEGKQAIVVTLFMPSEGAANGEAGELMYYRFLEQVDPPAQTHIKTAAELDEMRNDANGSYILDNDIDMAGVSWTPFEFYGTLDGNSFSIKNLKLEINNENVGLFSVINGATIKNLGVEDIYIACTNQGGAIAGVAVNGATIEKSFATGEVNSGGLTGGFLGRADESTVSESYTKITVNGHDHVGGLVGHMNGGTIVNCYTDSEVYSDAWQVGGLVGWAQNAGASISKSFAKGTVKSESGFTGGILGIADGGEKVVNITECLAFQTKLTTVNPDIAKTYRIIAAENAGVYSKNYGLESIELSDPNKEAWKDSVGGKDGGSITAAQVLDAQFYADSLTWDFENVWVMTDEGPELKWAYSPDTAVKEFVAIPESDAIVFSKYGKVWVNDAERDAQIKVYNINGVLLYQKQNVSTSESFEVKGVAIVLIQTPTRRSVHKVVNF